MLHRLPPDILHEKIIAWGEEHAKLRQLYQRLEKLLENRLNIIEREWRSRGLSSARARRVSLTDPRYLAFVEEYLMIKTRAHHCRVQWKTHRMLLHAIKSARIFAK